MLTEAPQLGKDRETGFFIRAEEVKKRDDSLIRGSYPRLWDRNDFSNPQSYNFIGDGKNMNVAQYNRIDEPGVILDCGGKDFLIGSLQVVDALRGSLDTIYSPGRTRFIGYRDGAITEELVVQVFNNEVATVNFEGWEAIDSLEFNGIRAEDNRYNDNPSSPYGPGPANSLQYSVDNISVQVQAEI